MTDIRLVAEHYIAAGWSVVPLVNGQKRAADSWQNKTYSALEFNPGDGIAGKCGAPSGWRVDVDLDHPVAVAIAPHLLPTTGLVHGRADKRQSHHWYVCDGAKSQAFKCASGMLVEIRSTGCYTALPPSGHPSGDTLAWEAEITPLTIDPDALVIAVRNVAIATLLALHWPVRGAIHDAIGPLAGFLLRAGIDPRFVLEIIKCAARAANDGDIDDRLNYAKATIAKWQADPNAPLTGGPKLAEAIGDDVVARLRSWLRVNLVLDDKDPMTSARCFIEDYHTIDNVIALRHQADVFYRYDGVYLEREDAAVRSELYHFLEAAKCNVKGQLTSFKPTKSKTENVLDALKALTNLRASMSSPCWLTPRDLDPMHLLPCRNGLLHLPTRELLPLTPQFFTLNGLSFDYDPTAAPPTEWLNFLSSAWPSDPEAIDTLQELFGYALTVDTSFQKIFMIVGPKRSGKGTIARVLRDLIGSRNMCSPTLASFGNAFGKHVLIGKTLAVISDARLSTKTDAASVAETLLSISGEDSQTIARKFLPDWNGQLLVRFLLLTNELPRINDISGALASRFIILAMQQSFFGREDRGLYSRLKPEVPSILNWALDGRDRLYQRGYFVQPTSAAATAQQLEDIASPITAFLRECCDIRQGAEIKKKELFAAWKRWCEANNVMNVGTTQTFGRDLRAALPNLGDGQRRPDRDWFWKGLALKAPDEMPFPPIPF